MRLILGLAVGASMAIVLPSSPAHAVTLGPKISRGEVIARAETWLSEKVPYDGSSYWPEAGGTTEYRQDCSGFVSMAWDLPTSASTRTLPNYASQISKSELRAGDILNRYDVHVVLFDEWANDAHTSFWYYAQANTVDDMDHKTASLSSFSSYTAYRYSRIFNAEGGTAYSGSVTGASCYVNSFGTVHLTDIRNVDVWADVCIIRTAPTFTESFIKVRWAPSTGADDSTNTTTPRFDSFKVRVQAQRNDVTEREVVCTITSMINSNLTGNAICTAAGINGLSGQWTADGLLHWNENNDGLWGLDPWYVHGSPIITI